MSRIASPYPIKRLLQAAYHPSDHGERPGHADRRADLPDEPPVWFGDIHDGSRRLRNAGYQRLLALEMLGPRVEACRGEKPSRH
jgi:hypothetical protein